MALLVVWAFVAITAADTAQPLIAGVDVSPPRKVKGVQAEFPDTARRAVPPVEGLVLLQVTLNETGRPADIVVLSGSSVLDFPAIEAVRRWEYEPTVVDGTPRRVLLKAVVEFFLSSKSRQRHLVDVATSVKEDTGLRLYAIQSLVANPVSEKDVRNALEAAATDGSEKVANAARQGLSRLGHQ